MLLTPLVLPGVMRLLTRLEPAGAADERRSDRSLGRLRLIVVQVLVFSLFATLFARLYYLQVVSGDAYRQAAAASRCARSSSSRSAA